MVSQQQGQESLQQRISDLLHGKHLDYAVEEAKEESVEAVFSLLKRAEQELQTAQEKVDRLKWELEKARS